MNKKNSMDFIILHILSLSGFERSCGTIMTLWIRAQRICVLNNVLIILSEYPVVQSNIFSFIVCLQTLYVSGSQTKFHKPQHPLCHGRAKVAHCVTARWCNFSHYCCPLRQYDVWFTYSEHREALAGAPTAHGVQKQEFLVQGEVHSSPLNK